MAVEKKPLYLNSDPFYNFLVPLAVLGFFASVWVVLLGRGFTGGSYMGWVRMIGFVWAIVPPLWWVYEYFFYFPRHGNPDAGYAQLKVTQDLATKLWLGVLVVLAVLYTAAAPA